MKYFELRLLFPNSFLIGISFDYGFEIFLGAISIGFYTEDEE